MSISIQLTKDHSHTLYVPELDETYHSRNGAIEEAMYVYIGRGLLDFVAEGDHESRIIDHRKQQTFGKSAEESIVHSPQTTVSGEPENRELKTTNGKRQTVNVKLLEIGFGTGLNAWLTALACAKNNLKCVYHSLETYPLPTDITEQLNYSANATDAEKELFKQLHTAEWNKPVSITTNFELTKHHVSLQAFVPSEMFDIIYFDAFAPEKQPELWSEDGFQKLYDCLNLNGIIVTYSSKGDVKRLWKKIGFEVERLPGPPLKRHMLRGRKPKN